MKQKLKRLTALILALAMALSLLCTSAWAAEIDPADTADASVAEVVGETAEEVTEEIVEPETAEEPSGEVAELETAEEPSGEVAEPETVETGETEQDKSLSSIQAEGTSLVGSASNDYTQWKQTDAEWNRAEAWPASEYPNATMRWMKQAGCVVTSIAMLLRHYNVVTDSNVNSFNPWICNEKLKSVGAFNSAADLYWGSVEKAYSGFKYAGSAGYSLSKLTSLYNNGYACVVAVNGGGHYVAVRSISGNTVNIMDPGYNRTTLSVYGSISNIYYFSVSGKPNNNPNISISGANSPGTITVGNVFSISGTVTSGQNLTKVTAGVYDLNGNMKTGRSATPNSTSYNIKNLDNYVYFNKLPAGVYTYRVDASNASKSATLVSKVFIVLGNGRTINDGTYTFVSKCNSNYGISVAGNSENSGANLHLWTYKSTNNYMKWKISYVSNGYYKIINAATGKAMDVNGASGASKTNVQQYDSNNTAAQLWQILPAGSYYCLVPKCGTSCCLDAYGGTASNGVNIQIYVANLTNAQLWRFSGASLSSSGSASTPSKTTLSSVTNVKGKKMTVKWKKNTSGTGYEIQYSTDKNFKKNVTKKTISKNKTTSATYSKLTKGKTYYVRIRTIGADSTKSAWSSVKQVKITK